MVNEAAQNHISQQQQQQEHHHHQQQQRQNATASEAVADERHNEDHILLDDASTTDAGNGEGRSGGQDEQLPRSCYDLGGRVEKEVDAGVAVGDERQDNGANALIEEVNIMPSRQLYVGVGSV